jgi:hypothetical protein
MPMFYFNILRGNQRIQDTEGADLPDVEVAREEAVTAAREVVANAVRKGEAATECSFEITDDKGRLLLSVAFPQAQTAT